MSLVKIPLICILTLAYNAMFTPPNPLPAKEDLVERTQIEWISWRKFTLPMLRLGQTLLSAVEIVAIIASNNPSSSASQKILSLTFFKGKDPGKLQLHPLSYLAAFLWLSGYAMRMRTFRDLGQFFHFHVSVQKDHQLITSGLYTYVRHPSYSGIILADLGFCLWHGTRGSWVRESQLLDSAGGIVALSIFVAMFMLPGPALTLSRMSKEDEALRRKFGKKWDTWANKVPYRLIPGVY